jgi:hypothetical protein
MMEAKPHSQNAGSSVLINGEDAGGAAGTRRSGGAAVNGRLSWSTAAEIGGATGGADRHSKRLPTSTRSEKGIKNFSDAASSSQ